jgi:hypothetical protein
MRGRPFQRGKKFGRGRPQGSRNKKSLALQELLLGQGANILQKMINCALEGDRTAQVLCMERLIPRVKPVPELPIEQPQEDPQLTTNEQTETQKVDLSGLTEGELRLLDQLLAKAEGVDPGEGSSGAPAQEAA